jgi:hypothetical protein
LVTKYRTIIKYVESDVLTAVVSEESIASIFRVEERAEQETGVKAGGKQSSEGDMFLRSFG